MKFVAGMMLVLLSWTIVMQYNDPDGWVWMLIYGAAWAATLRVFMRPFPRGIHLLLGCGYAVGALATMPEEFVDWIDDEIARECLGLLICAIWMVVLVLTRPGSAAAKPVPSP